MNRNIGIGRKSTNRLPRFISETIQDGIIVIWNA